MTARVVLAAASAGLASPAAAQGTAFQTPGMPRQAQAPAEQPADSGQTDRFSSVFNPAFSFVVDTVADYVDPDAPGADDGVDLSLRVLELSAQSWVDPNAWAYFIAAADEESLSVEEAAVHWTGLGERATLRAGRFFVDFGKQMQVHVHELRTLERPLVLRTYLGDEVKGDGLQYDGWAPLGDSAALRWSFGAFASLLPEAEEDEDGGAALAVAERKDAGDLNFTARVTGFGDVGDQGVLQVGASARVIPEFSAGVEGQEPLTGFDSTVLGLDVTYGWTSDDALRTWTVGGELLLNTGDTAPLFDAGGDLTGFDDGDQLGWFAFVDYAWGREHAVGVQYGALEQPLAGSPDASEIELYYTRWFSEFHRLRLAAASFESDVPDEDALRLALQYTAIVGAHGHGVSW